MNDIAQMQQIITSSIRTALPQTQAVLLYGSHARGEAWADSDVDIAVLAPTRIDPKVLFDLSGDLQLALRRDVDLVDARAIPHTLRAALLVDAKPLGAFDERALREWEAQSLTAYGLFNNERHALLQDFWAGGAVPARAAAA